MGVITTGVVPAGTLFGPIPSNLGLTDPAFLIGHMTTDNRTDVHTVKMDVTELADLERAGDWVPYVRAARDDRELNVEALLRDGQLHYRSTRTLTAGTELLVWYSRDFALILGVPELQPFHIKEGGIFTCPYCMSNFRYPNSLRAHMRFKCEHRRPGPTVSTSMMPAVGEVTQAHSRLFPSAAFPFMSSRFERDVFSAYPRIINPGHALTPDAQDTLPSPASSTSSAGPTISRHSPNVVETSSSSPNKRASSDDMSESPPSKRASLDSPVSSPRLNTSCPSPNSSPEKQEKRDSLDQNQNLNSTKDEEETVSAFRKVEKHSSRPNMSPPLSLTSSGKGFSPPTSAVFTSPAFSAKQGEMPSPKNLYPSPASFLPHYPMVPGAVPPPLVPVRSYGENMPFDVREIYRHAVKIGELPRVTGKLIDIHNIENRRAFVPDARTGLLPIHFYKSNNPMVEKLLQSTAVPIPPPVTSLAVAQNWCAKCNATFRMTSDLVYHMRSHHKEQPDPIKKKREEKLKCNICGESFRERHHLTRHMTSHI